MHQLSAKIWYRYQVEAKCKDTNGNIRDDIGFVAINFTSEPTSTGTNRTALAQVHTGYNPYRAYMLAKGDGNWQFDHWELETGATISDSNQEKGTASYKYYSKQRCSSTSSHSHVDSDYTTDYTFYAVFREVITQVVFAETQPSSLGEVKYMKENSIGDVITLRTYSFDYHNKFLGWVKQGDENNIITTDRVLTFTITDETKGTYIAKYDNGYNFVRFKNFGTGRYMDFTSDEGSLQDLTSLELKSSLNDVVSEAGSVIEIKEGDVKSSSGTSKRHYFDFYMQNAKTSKFYDFDPTNPNAVTYGTYLRMPHDVDDNVDTWALSTDDDVLSGYRIGDQNGAPYVYMGKRNEADWYIEPMDKDLDTKENYFSLDPNKLVKVGDKYYTTLRTSWNILIDPGRTKPYVVTAVDEQAGTFEMEPITGNIIPAGTPVIIETSSTDIEANRMVPTLTTAASGAVPEGNLLKVSTKYFPNQDPPVSNCKGLYKNANGQLAFGGNALTTVNGNEAYLSVATEVVLPTKAQDITLAELVRSGNTKTLYNITDLTAVDAVDHATMLICKDNNGYASKDENTEQYIDFMHTLDSGSGLTSTVPVTYDQSNWIGLRLPGDAEFTDGSLRNKLLKGVVGRLVNTTNPEFVLDKNSLAVNEQGIAAPTSLNPFVAASFYGQNPQTSSVNSKEYFFVQPKPMEMANVEWAQWNGEKFVAPLKSSNNNWNPVNLQGEFEFNGSYLEQGGVFLEDGHVYAMIPAVVKLKDDNYNNYNHVYVLGTVNGQNSGEWNPAKGVEMSTRDGNIYIATVNVDNSGDNFGYFSFTKKLGENWSDINAYRFGANTESMSYAPDYPINDDNMGQELPLRDDWSDGTRPFKIAAGTYKLVVDLKAKSLVVSVPVQNAPRLAAEGGKQYVVYPLNITKVTTVENGVITAIDGVRSGKVAVEVVYYNLMGVASDKPHHGINIVETRYSDGSRSAVKVVK